MAKHTKDTDHILDLSDENHSRFDGYEVKDIANLVYGYWKRGHNLTKVILSDYDFVEFKHNAMESLSPARLKPESNSLFINFGFGEVEVYKASIA